MRYALFGDSHAQAVFPLLEKELSQNGHEVVISKPMAGWTLLKHLDNHFESLLGDSAVDILVLSLGGNNANLTASYGNTIQIALSIAKNSGVKEIYWVSPAWAIRDDVQKRHEWTTNYLKSNLPRGVRFIDMRELTQIGHRSDGVHFISSKYKEWARFVSSHLLSNSAITQIPKIALVSSLSLLVLGIVSYFWRKERK